MQLVVVSLLVATEHDIFSEAVSQELHSLTQSLGETRKDLLGHQRGDGQTQDGTVKRDGREHERGDKVAALPHLDGDGGGSVQVRVGDEDVVPTVDDIGATVLLQLRDVEGPQLVDVRTELAVVSLDDFQTLSDGGSRERVGTGGKTDTRGNGEGLDESVVGDDVTAIGRKGLGEDTTDVITGTDHVEVLLNTVTGLTEGTERVGLVHNNLNVELVAESPSLGQVGNGSVSGVDSINNKERATGVLVTVLLHQITEGFVVLVRELDDLSTGQLGTVPQTDMALLVHEDDTTLRAQIGDQVHASKETRSGERTVFTVEELLHVLIGLFDDSVLTQQQVRTVVTGTGLKDLLESVLADLLVDVEAPVRQRRHQSAPVLVTRDLDGDTIVGLVEGKTRGEGPVFVDVFEVLVTQDLSSDIDVRLQNSLVGDDGPLGLDGRLDQTTSQIQVGQITVVLTAHEQLLGHLVLFDLLGDELRGLSDDQGSGSREKEKQSEQQHVGEGKGTGGSPDGSDINQSNHL